MFSQWDEFIEQRLHAFCLRKGSRNPLVWGMCSLLVLLPSFIAYGVAHLIHCVSSFWMLKKTLCCIIYQKRSYQKTSLLGSSRPWLSVPPGCNIYQVNQNRHTPHFHRLLLVRGSALITLYTNTIWISFREDTWLVCVNFSWLPS